MLHNPCIVPSTITKTYVARREFLFATFKYQGFIATENETQFSSLEEKKADEMEVAAQAHEERKAKEKAATIIN